MPAAVRLALALALAAAAVLASAAPGARPAAAQPSAAAKAEAKQAFQRAEAAERRKDWRTAIAEYQRAYELVPHPFTLFNVALNFERLEEFRDAATYYRRYLDESPDAADRDRVEALIERLRARPGRVTVVSDPDGAEVRVDGKLAGVTPLELRLAGAHRIEVAGAGGVTARRDVVVEFGEPAEVRVAVAARPGVLVVASNVQGARVTIDGVDAGVTPLRIAVPAGPHQVVVSADGWSTYERPVEVPAEGSTQVTANLVRPLGYVPPTPERAEPRGYFAVRGGADVAEEGGIVDLVVGGHRGALSYGLGYQFARGAAAFLLETRVAFGSGKFRPYLRASAALGAASSIAAHAGGLFELELGGSARTAVFVEVGAGIARDVTADERALYVPALGGVQLSY